MFRIGIMGPKDFLGAVFFPFVVAVDLRQGISMNFWLSWTLLGGLANLKLTEIPNPLPPKRWD